VLDDRVKEEGRAGWRTFVARHSKEYARISLPDCRPETSGSAYASRQSRSQPPVGYLCAADPVKVLADRSTVTFRGDASSINQGLDARVLDLADNGVCIRRGRVTSAG
jgi:hypothetical protein